jgi:hypothetical protein
MSEPAEVSKDIYSIEKLMHETRLLAAKYREQTGTALPLTGEIARFDASKNLQLKLIDDPNSSYDAIGLYDSLKQQKIIIKGRVIFDKSKSSPRLGQLNVDADWDAVVLVLYDESYQPVEMYSATKEDIQQALEMNGDSPRKKRGAMSIAQFKIIGTLSWTEEDGIEPEIWDNH